jgi:molybdopterin-guanine dinucleotide biosynthesis protein A
VKSLSIIILAGGKSTRMGSDKAFLPWGNTTFLGQIINAVLPLTGEIYLSGDNARLYDFGLPVIQDLRPNEGPVTALASCFPQIKTELVLVLSCDVPQIKTQDLQVLLNTVKPDLDMTMFSFQNRALPLVAVYGRRSFTAFEAAFQHRERKLFNVLEKLKTQTIVFDGEGGLENVNTREDFEEISQRKSEKTQRKKTL